MNFTNSLIHGRNTTLDSKLSMTHQLKVILGAISITAAKVSALVISLFILSIALLPILIIEAAVRASYKVSSYFLTKTDSLKPRLIVLAASKDSLLGSSVSLALNDTQRRLIKNYQIEVYRVSNIEEINKHLVEGNGVAGIWFAVHANSAKIYLNPDISRENGVITHKNVSRLDFSKISLDVPIIIEGCEAGNEENETICIARRIAQVSKGHKVFAPTKTINEFSTIISSKQGDPLEIQWRRPCFTERDSNFLDHVLASLWTVMLATTPSFFRNHRFVTTDITLMFQSSVI